MKQTKLKLELKVKRRLELVRNHLRELTGAELEQIQGGAPTARCDTCNNVYTK
jgi:hypothetical protein